MRPLPIAAVLLCGCGPSFVGTFNGTLNTNTSCSDGTGGDNNFATTWKLTENGSTVMAEPNGGCTPLLADAKGNVATLEQKTCPARNLSNGVTVTTTVTGGQLTLGDGTLTILIDDNGQLTGAAIGTCRNKTTGTLTRQK